MRELRQLREENGKLKRLVADLAPAFCAEQLNQARWSARVALRSRDQGVEIIAEKSGLQL